MELAPTHLGKITARDSKDNEAQQDFEPKKNISPSIGLEKDRMSPGSPNLKLHSCSKLHRGRQALMRL
jgi:hypothetical protein